MVPPHPQHPKPVHPILGGPTEGSFPATRGWDAEMLLLSRRCWRRSWGTRCQRSGTESCTAPMAAGPAASSTSPPDTTPGVSGRGRRPPGAGNEGPQRLPQDAEVLQGPRGWQAWKPSSPPRSLPCSQNGPKAPRGSHPPDPKATDTGALPSCQLVTPRGNTAFNKVLVCRYFTKNLLSVL